MMGEPPITRGAYRPHQTPGALGKLPPPKTPPKEISKGIWGLLLGAGKRAAFVSFCTVREGRCIRLHSKASSLFVSLWSVRGRMLSLSATGRCDKTCCIGERVLYS